MKRVEISLSFLPVPKSNRYIRKKGGVVFKPPKIKNWEARAIWEIKQQYEGDPLDGPLSMEVFLVLPNRRKRDIDNMLKSLWDVLEKARVIKNDNQIHEVRTVKLVEKDVQKTIVFINHMD